jgi:periplasmic protein TonB
MNNLAFNPVYRPKDQSRQFKGIAVVVAIHALLGWAIISGTAHDALKAIKKPLEAVVIQEVIIPPPPPPPPKEIKPPEALKAPEAPPPPFVPPPDVAPPVTAAPAIQSVQAPPPTPVVIAPPPPKVEAPVVAARPDIRVACPTQVPPEMPRKATQEGTEGIVRAEVTIRDGAVKEVQILSGPRVFHAAVKNAMMQYKCQSGSGEVKATQEFVFKLE